MSGYFVCHVDSECVCVCVCVCVCLPEQCAIWSVNYMMFKLRLEMGVTFNNHCVTYFQ